MVVAEHPRTALNSANRPLTWGGHAMMNRRTFAALLAGTVAGPGLSWGQAAKGKTALYSGVGPEFTHYEVDVEAATLAKRGSVKLNGGGHYAWPHPSRRFLYVSSSTGGPGEPRAQHHRAP